MFHRLRCKTRVATRISWLALLLFFGATSGARAQVAAPAPAPGPATRTVEHTVLAGQFLRDLGAPYWLATPAGTLQTNVDVRVARTLQNCTSATSSPDDCPVSFTVRSDQRRWYLNVAYNDYRMPPWASNAGCLFISFASDFATLDSFVSTMNGFQNAFKVSSNRYEYKDILAGNVSVLREDSRLYGVSANGTTGIFLYNTGGQPADRDVRNGSSTTISYTFGAYAASEPICGSALQAGNTRLPRAVPPVNETVTLTYDDALEPQEFRMAAAFSNASCIAFRLLPLPVNSNPGVPTNDGRYWTRSTRYGQFTGYVADDTLLGRDMVALLADARTADLPAVSANASDPSFNRIPRNQTIRAIGAACQQSSGVSATTPAVVGYGTDYQVAQASNDTLLVGPMQGCQIVADGLDPSQSYIIWLFNREKDYIAKAQVSYVALSEGSCSGVRFPNPFSTEPTVFGGALGVVNATPPPALINKRTLVTSMPLPLDSTPDSSLPFVYSPPQSPALGTQSGLGNIQPGGGSSSGLGAGAIAGIAVAGAAAVALAAAATGLWMTGRLRPCGRRRGPAQLQQTKSSYTNFAVDRKTTGSAPPFMPPPFLQSFKSLTQPAKPEDEEEARTGMLADEGSAPEVIDDKIAVEPDESDSQSGTKSGASLPKILSSDVQWIRRTQSQLELSRASAASSTVQTGARYGPAKEFEERSHSGRRGEREGPARSGSGRGQRPHLRKEVSLDPERLREVSDLLMDNWMVDISQLQTRRNKHGKVMVIGEGGYGKVYRGLLNGTDEVAVKVALEPDESKLARFKSEILLLRSCHNPSIVQFMGASITDGATFLVMEYMPNGDLETMLRSDRRLDFGWYKRGKDIALEVAKGLVYLHTNRIVHLDIKPANVLLTKEFRAKIADVGLGKPIPRSVDTISSSSPGTFKYAAPEQLYGEPLSFSADIFAFGVLLWEICTLESPVKRFYREIEVPKESPSTVRNLIWRCVEHDAPRRPTADEVFATLKRAIDEE